MDNHKGNDTFTADKQFGQIQRRIDQKIQEREKELQELRKAVETLKSSAQTAVEDSERIFTEMIRSIERRRSEVTELIRAQEKAEVSRAEGLLKRLEQEIAELKRRDAELEQLSHTQDHIHFLKNAPSMRDIHSMTLSQSFSFEAVRESVSAVRTHLEEKLDGIFKQNVAKIPAAVSNIQDNVHEPVTREEFLKYSCRFTLDPNTANSYLHLSEGNRRVEYRDKPQPYPDHPERFDEWWPQVLCREGVSGRCYWEVEWSEEADIAVSYKSISRKGEGYECGFGASDQSWGLTLCSSSSSFWHNNKETKLPLVASSRIGVYVDHRAGTLAFYSISDTMTLLHRVQTTFMEKLYPGFFIHFGSSVKLL